MTAVTRTVFLTHSGADSGAEQSTVAYLARWPEGETAPLLMVGGPGPIEERARGAGVDVLRMEVNPGAVTTRRDERRVGRLVGGFVRLLRHSSRVRGVLRTRSADVVVAISLKSLVFGWLAGRRSRAAVVWSLHDRVDGRYFSWFLVPVLRYVLPRLVDGIAVNSWTTLATIRPGRTPVIVATPAIELDPRDFHGRGDEVLRVVMLGRLSPWKGQDLFLKAFAGAFADSGAEAYVVGGALFGEDDFENTLRHQAVELGLSERVHFVGHVSDPWAWLDEANILVHASRIPEPFGQVVVEGLWARCAVVATRPGGPEEVITHGWDGLLVPGDDEAAMTDALRLLREDPALRRRLAAQGHETARRFDVAVCAPVLARWLADLRDGRLAASSVATTLPPGPEGQIRSANVRS